MRGCCVLQCGYDGVVTQRASRPEALRSNTSGRMRFDLVAYVLGYILIGIALSMMPSLLDGPCTSSSRIKPLLLYHHHHAARGNHHDIREAFASGVGQRRPHRTRRILDCQRGMGARGRVWRASVLSGGDFRFDRSDSVRSHYRLHQRLIPRRFSGFTTTGASVLTNFDQPRGIMFWRSLTHWLGGMGIIVLSLAILPAIGVGRHADVPRRSSRSD